MKIELMNWAELQDYIAEKTGGHAAQVYGGWIVYGECGRESRKFATLKKLAEYVETCITRGFDPLD